jgi:predicted CoA-binding protein
VVPVPTYYPEVTEILGQKVYRRVADVPGQQLDCVCVFRKPEDVTAHVDDILAAKPKCVWLQQGIRNDEAAEAWARAGLLVVQDRCLLIEHRRARL